MVSRQGLILAYLCILVCTLLACKNEDEQPESNVPDGSRPSPILTVAIRQPTALDPAFLQGANDFQIAHQLFAALYRIDPLTSDPIPDLARAHTTSEDGLTWTFKLNKARTFSDGTPIEARHFVHAWSRLINPATASTGADVLHFITGAQACVEGKDCAPGFQAPRKDTLVLKLTHPNPHLPAILASPRLSPLPESFDGARKDAMTPPLTALSGAYLLYGHIPDQHVELKANPSHPRGAQAAIKNVVFRFTQSEESAMTWWRTSEVQLVVGLVPLGDVPTLRQTSPEALVMVPRRSLFYLLINHQRDALKSREVRAHIAASLQRKALVLQVLGSGQKSAGSFVPALYGEHGFSPSQCKWSSLQESPQIRPLELLCNSSRTLQMILEFLQQNLSNNAGIQTDLRFLEWGSFLSIVQNQGFDLARMSFTGGADPLELFENFQSDHPNNMGKYSNPEYDAAVEAARNTRNSASKHEALEKAHAILCRDVPAIPVYFSSQVYLVKPNLRHAFRPDVEGTFDLAQLQFQ